MLDRYGISIIDLSESLSLSAVFVGMGITIFFFVLSFVV